MGRRESIVRINESQEAVEPSPAKRQFREKVIPEADRELLNLAVTMLSNNVIQELRLFAQSGTLIGYLVGIIAKSCHV